VKYILNEVHRNTTDDELLQDVRNTAEKLGKKSLSVDEYNRDGVYSYSTLRKRFGSWKDVLTLAGLSIEQRNFYISTKTSHM
jgi:hypothetical protein